MTAHVVAATADWRQEVSVETRTEIVTQLCHELVRISGETDRDKVWCSAAKYELSLWMNAVNQETYLTKLHRKIETLKRKERVQPMELARQRQAQEEAAAARAAAEATIRAIQAAQAAQARIAKILRAAAAA